jgi:adenylate kinase family enzyme
MRNRIILIVGYRGSGKSTVASSILRANSGIFLCDVHGDPAYSWIKNTARNVEE